MATDPRVQPSPSLEQALTVTTAATDVALRASASATRAIKQARAAANVGNLRDLRSALTAAQQAVAALEERLAEAVASWEFDEEAYLATGAYTRELLNAASRANLAIFEQDDRLFCYPALLRVLPSERVVQVDRDRVRGLRPSVLVTYLQRLQGRPPRFRPEAFLETLLKAYDALAARHGKDAAASGLAVKLTDVYDLLTLLPGQAREYARQEFARDIYLLDRSAITKTRSGRAVSFPGSTGTRSASSVIRVITQSGEEKTYYGVAFTSARAG